MSVPVPPVETGPGADPSPASSLSRKCTNCGRTGHNSRTCLESREAPAGSLDARTASEVINFVAEQHRQQLAEKGKEEEEEVGAPSDQESAGNNQRERKKGETLVYKSTGPGPHASPQASFWLPLADRSSVRTSK